MKSQKIFLLFVLVASHITNNSYNNFILANQKNTFSIISDTQSLKDGNLEAFGNVIINNESNFSAKSNKLIYEKKQSRLYLKGNVEIENYEIENLFIENLKGDEFVLFTNKNEFQINSKKGNRVKTKLKF